MESEIYESYNPSSSPSEYSLQPTLYPTQYPSFLDPNQGDSTLEPTFVPTGCPSATPSLLPTQLDFLTHHGYYTFINNMWDYHLIVCIIIGWTICICLLLIAYRALAPHFKWNKTRYIIQDSKLEGDSLTTQKTKIVDKYQELKDDDCQQEDKLNIDNNDKEDDLEEGVYSSRLELPAYYHSKSCDDSSFSSSVNVGTPFKLNKHDTKELDESTDSLLRGAIDEPNLNNFEIVYDKDREKSNKKIIDNVGSFEVSRVLENFNPLQKPSNRT